MVFDPSMPTSEIQATVDAIAAQQVAEPVRDAALRAAVQARHVRLGDHRSTSRSATTPQVAGLGRSPGRRRHQRVGLRAQPVRRRGCVALNNFWRSLSNLTINVTTPNFGCYTGEFWAVSQAAPMRRVDVNGNTTLMDYCTGPSFASGGFIADSRFDGSPSSTARSSSGSPATARSTAGRTASGTRCSPASQGAPAQCFPAHAAVRRAVHDAGDEPGDPRGAVPLRRLGRATTRSSSRRRSTTPSGTTWSTGRPPGTSIPIATSSSRSRATRRRRSTPRCTAARTCSSRRASTTLDQTIEVKRADTVVLGLGFADARSRPRRTSAMTVADVPGVEHRRPACSTPGPKNSPVLLAGRHEARRTTASAADPTDAAATCSSASAARHAGKADDEPRGQQRQRDPRRHLGLAGRPRQRRRLDGQHRRHRRGRQRRRRHGVRPVRRALPEVPR